MLASSAPKGFAAGLRADVYALAIVMWTLWHAKVC